MIINLHISRTELLSIWASLFECIFFVISKIDGKMKNLDMKLYMV